MTLEWISVIAAVVSAIAAISSLGWAAKANQKANKANKIAKDSLELTYRQSLEEHPTAFYRSMKSCTSIFPRPPHPSNDETR